MNKKYSYLEESELLELTDADLEGVYGGKCCDYPGYSDYDYASTNAWDPQTRGLLNLVSGDNILNDFLNFS